MRAVNLIPTDQQRGAGGAAGKSGGGAYILLGALALCVALASAYVVSGRSVNDKKAELARITQEATAAEQKAQTLQSYTKFSSISAKRVETVTQLAASRFDWSHSLREVARVLPTNAWLTSLTGTTSPTVSVGGGGGGSLRSALAVPAIEVQGCTTSQASVAKLMARLRLIDGVQRVSLEDSTKGEAARAGAGVSDAGASSSTDCRGGSSHFPLFKVVVFYEPTASTLTTTAGATPQTAAATGATASSTTPASTSASSTTPSTTSSAASGGATP
jgi:Tfp pilus assembly protein PilN